MKDLTTRALESAEACGQQAAVLFWNGAHSTELFRLRRDAANEFDAPRKAIFNRDYRFWFKKTLARFRDSKAAKAGGAVQGEHVVVMYSDGGFMFVRREQTLDLAEHHPVIREMLAVLKEISPEAYAEIAA